MCLRLYYEPMSMSLIKVNVLVFYYLKADFLTPAYKIPTVFIKIILLEKKENNSFICVFPKCNDPAISLT